MKSHYNYARQIVSWPLAIGLAVFVSFFVFINYSSAQETNLPAETQNINQPTEVFDREKAIAITKERGGPGGCKTEAACTSFCNANQEECMVWAKDNGVMSSDKFDKYIGFAKSGGPGGCKTESDCKSYCEAESHFDECIGFAEKQGIISKEDAQRAKKTGPGGCKTAKECNAFCEQPQNQNTCLDAAVAEGFMSEGEVQRVKEFQKTADEFRRRAEEFKKRAKEEFERPEIEEIDPGFDKEKAKQILETESGPGGCKTFDECENFCENPANQETCFKFAEDKGLFKNTEHIGKIKTIISEGGPGGCKGEKACRNFCEQEANFETCIGFAEKQGLIKPEELEKAKKGIKAIKEGGPLGCKTKESCETICEDPANQEACFNWAKSSGLISEEEVRFMEEAKKFRGEFEGKRAEFENRSREQSGGFPGPSQFPGRSGEFPGKPPSGSFPPGQIPPGFEKEFESRAREFQQKGSQGLHAPEGFEGQKSPEGFRPPEGGQPTDQNQQFKEQYRQQYEQQYQQQQQQQFQQQYQQQQQQFQQPPTGGTFTPPPGGGFTPPPSGEFNSPPPSGSAPTPAPAPAPSSLLQHSPFGVILKFFLGQ